MRSGVLYSVIPLTALASEVAFPGSLRLAFTHRQSKTVDAVEARVDHRSMRREDQVRVALRSGGGFISRFLPQDAGRRSALDSLIEAERSFSRASVKNGIRAAFLEYLDERSIVFRPGPVDGRTTYGADPESKVTLSWSPIFADVSASGDFGYTTGPWTLSEDQQGTKPLRYGHYMSVWRRKPGGQWHVAIDLGTTHPQPGKRSGNVDSPAPTRTPKPKGQAAEQSAVLAADRSFSSASQARGFAKAFQDFAAPGVRLYRRNHFPFVKPDAVRSALESNQAAISWTPSGGDVAASGDLAFTYGLVRSAEGGREIAGYCRVWRKQPDGAWKVVVDVESPFPPSP